MLISSTKQILTQAHMSLSFFFIFVAYQSLENIQSSLNFEAGLGTISISLVYAGYLCSSLIVGSPVVHILTPKWAMFLAFFSHTIFILANFYPVWGTMLPASLLLGVAAGPYWIAQGTYSTVLAVRYSDISGSSLDHVTAKFSSIFYAFWGAAKPIGNLVTSVVLNFDKNINNNITEFDNETTINHGNISWIQINQTVLKEDYCGPNHCPFMEEHQETLRKPSAILVYTMTAIFLLFNILGIITAGTLKNVPATKHCSISQRILTTVHIIKEPDMMLLIIPSALVGIIPGTYYATFAQSVVSCIFGIEMVGYTMLCEGLGFTLASLLCGPLTKYMHRIFHTSLAILTFIAFGFWFLFLKPGTDQLWLVVIISLVYGLMHGTFRTHMSALVSLLFNDQPEAAFAQYNIWMGVGFTVTFAYTNFLCYKVKMYIFLTAALLTGLSYYALEWRIHTLAVDEKGKSFKKRKFSHSYM